MITAQGRTIIFRYLAGYIPQIAQSIALGTGASSESAGSTRLDFEAGRVEINLTSADIVNDKIVFKATIPQEFIGKIYEAGLWSSAPAQANFGSQTIVSFDSESEDWTGGTFVTSGARIGEDALQLSATSGSPATATLEGITMDLSGFSNADEFLVAYQADAGAGSIEIVFKTDDSNYYSYTITPSTGYHVASFAKSGMTGTGTPDWSNITEVEVTLSTSSTSTSLLDGIRVEDTDTISTDYVLVARTVLPSPVTKTDASEMDIEYAIEVNI